MSGRAKRNIYLFAEVALFLIACAAGLGVAALFSHRLLQGGSSAGVVLRILFAFVAAFIVLLADLPVFVHELGHLCFGACAGMKVKSFHVKFLFRHGGGGFSEFVPRKETHLRGKLIATALGGSVFDLLFGGALYALTFTLPNGFWAIFCAVSAPFFLWEGIRALIPAELATGKTDGGILLGIMLHRAEEEVALRVLIAQTIEERGEEIPASLLYDMPAIREDAPVFHALLLLRARIHFRKGEVAEGEATLARLLEIEELGEETRAQIEEIEEERKKSALDGR